MKPYVYLDANFYEFLNEILRKGIDSVGFDDYYRIRSFITNKDVNVVLNYEKNPDNHLLNDFVKVKGGKATEDNGIVKCQVINNADYENEVIKIGSKSPFSICFSSSKKIELKEFVQKSGYHFIDKSSFKSFLSLPFISGKNAFGVNKTGDIKSWQDFKKLSHSFNTLIIFDRFLFTRNKKSTHSNYKETIPEIVSNLLQNNTSEKIDLLLVSVKNSGSDVGYSLKEIKEAIELELKNKHISTTLNISIARCKEITDNNHDRMIFTNLCAMVSGNSFNYFENKSIKTKAPAINTTLSVYSIIDYDNWKAYSHMLKARKKELPTPEDLNIPNEDLREGRVEIELLAFI